MTEPDVSGRAGKKTRLEKFCSLCRRSGHWRSACPSIKPVALSHQVTQGKNQTDEALAELPKSKPKTPKIKTKKASKKVKLVKIAPKAPSLFTPLAVGKNVINLRTKLQLTQQELAEATSLKRSTIAHIERASSCITVSNLIALCTVLAVTPNDLLTPRSPDSKLEPGLNNLEPST